MTSRNDPAKVQRIVYLADLISRYSQIYSDSKCCPRNHLDYSSVIDCLQEALDYINIAISDDTQDFMMVKLEEIIEA